jgi:hypothetical protein
MDEIQVPDRKEACEMSDEQVNAELNTAMRMARDLKKLLGVPVTLPLTVELVDMADIGDDLHGYSALVLTTRNKSGGPMSVTAAAVPGQCGAMATMQLAAFQCFLATPRGQEAALAFIAHSFEHHEMWDWPECGSPCDSPYISIEREAEEG